MQIKKNCFVIKHQHYNKTTSKKRKKLKIKKTAFKKKKSDCIIYEYLLTKSLKKHAEKQNPNKEKQLIQQKELCKRTNKTKKNKN